MVYTVEVRLVGSDLLASMSDMRTWLDHRKVEPDAFRISRGNPVTTCRLDFRIENEAAAFATAFQGRLLGVPMPTALTDRG